MTSCENECKAGTAEMEVKAPATSTGRAEAELDSPAYILIRTDTR